MAERLITLDVRTRAAWRQWLAEHHASSPGVPELPEYIAEAFRSNRGVWEHFQALARRQRRDFVVWIHTAKRPETRERRIRESIALLAAGRQLGLK